MHRKLRPKEAYNLKDLLSKAEPYINYDKNLMADEGSQGMGIPEFGPTIENDTGKSKKENEQNPRSKFYSYTPLNTS